LITGVNNTRDKFLRQKVFSYFDEMLSDCLHTWYTGNEFLLYFHLRCRQADAFVAAVPLQVPLTPAIHFFVNGDKLLPV
jgi:hypothetical protein